MQSLKLALLGEARVFAGEAAVRCPAKKALALFCFLALTGRTHQRRDLARLFWGGDDEVSRTSLRTALQRLPSELAAYVAADRESLALAHPVELDAARFSALATATGVEELSEAARLYDGELLAGLDVDAAPEFDDWLHRERTRYRQLAHAVFDQLIARHRERAGHEAARAQVERDAAIAAARRWLAVEPGAEAAHRWLMQLFMDTGQRDAATAQYELCQRQMAVLHGRAPSADTRALAESIAGSSHAPARVAVASELPVETAVRAPELASTSFVGRIEELAQLEQLFRDPACRVLTLHGMGGVGKSRLAFALANQVASHFTLGATWVPLEAITSAEELPNAIARAIGVDLPAQAPALVALCAALRSQRRLLVLDNFEQLAPAGADVVLAIVREAPAVRLLITSRDVLDVQEEWVYEVPGLPFPAADGDAASSDRFSAIELFAQRARQAYVGFSAAAEGPHVARICRLVEGHPLAIELAAAWVRTMPCGDLARAIESELSALVARHRNRPARQRSLDAVVRTSWSLLMPDQQRLLAALSVFVDGFTHEGAETVAEASLRTISALVDKALVVRRAAGRLGLHPLVRQFAQRQLQARAANARIVQHRFTGHCAALLVRLRSQLDGPGELEAEEQIDAELANLLAAAPSWLDDPTEIAEPLLRVLMGRGLIKPLREYADRLLATPSLAPAARAMALAYKGRAEALVGNLADGLAAFDAAIALARQHSLLRPLAYALAYRTMVAHSTDRLDEAVHQLQEVEPMLADVGDPAITMRVRYGLGVVLDAMGRLAEAETAQLEALRLAREVDSPTFLATVQNQLANTWLKQGRWEPASAMLHEALELFERTGRKQSIGNTLNSLATALVWRAGPTDAADAARLAGRALRLFEEIGYTRAQSGAMDTLAQALWALKRLDEARDLFARAAVENSAIVSSEARFHWALLELQQGDSAGAARLALQIAKTAVGRPLAPLRRWTALLAAALAVHEGSNAAAARWLDALSAEGGLDIELRQRIDALRTALPANSELGASLTAEGLASETLAYLARLCPGE